MKEITKEMRDKLRAPLPPEAIKAHPTKTYLSSIKPIYVTERLNDVFGVGVWQQRAEMVERADKGTVIIKLSFSIPEYNVYYESFGGNDNGGEGSKNFDLGDAYKGASTDALTKIASFMEIGIDVFKGKGKPPEPKSKPKTEAKPTPPTSTEPPKPNPELKIKTENYSYAVKRLKEGVTLDVIKKHFTITEEVEKQLNIDAKA